MFGRQLVGKSTSRNKWNAVPETEQFLVGAIADGQCDEGAPQIIDNRRGVHTSSRARSGYEPIASARPGAAYREEKLRL